MSRSDVLVVGEKHPTDRCYTCGGAAPLTWAHIPAECVGNVGNMKPMTDVDFVTRQTTNTLRYERGFTEGGIRVKQQCASCNGKLSRYDAALKPFWTGGLYVRSVVLDKGGHHESYRPMQFDGIDPGAVVRSLIGSLSAVNDDVALDYPDMVKAVLDNTAYVPPSGLLIGLGLHTGTKCFATSGYEFLSPPDARVRRLRLQDQLASLAFPPYSLVIRRKAALNDPHFNVAEWLGETAGHSRQVSLILPVLTDADFQPPIHSEEPIDFVSAENALQPSRLTARPPHRPHPPRRRVRASAARQPRDTLQPD